MSILLLSVGFEPLAIISQRRAIGLLEKSKAWCVEGEPVTGIRSPSHVLNLPSVIRLKYYVQVPQRKARWSKPNVLRRDKYVCQFCGVKMFEADATVDHVVSLAECRKKQITPNTWGNTVASCRKCQKRKGERSMNEAGMRFHNSAFEPKAPRVNYLVLVLQNSKHEEWRKYIRV